MNRSKNQLVGVAAVALVLSLAPRAHAALDDDHQVCTQDSDCLPLMEANHNGSASSYYGAAGTADSQFCWTNQACNKGCGDGVHTCCNNQNTHASVWYGSTNSCCANPNNGSTFCGNNNGVCCIYMGGNQGGACPDYLTKNWAICTNVPGTPSTKFAVGAGPQATNDFSFGCNTDLFNDPNNCNSCGNICSTYGNTSPTCGMMGKCQFPNCYYPYADCNKLSGNPNDGCETDTSTNISNCGACGHACTDTPSHTTGPACKGSACTFLACSPEYADCTVAAGCETHIFADINNCGTGTIKSPGCGHICPGAAYHVMTPSCTAGVCGITTCMPGYGDCDTNHTTNGCETFLMGSDAKHCGGCMMACGATQYCNAGTCMDTNCPMGEQKCNGTTCQDTTSDVANCGACGAACSSNNISARACTAGVCTGPCKTGFGDCDGDLTNGCETNLNTGDVSNCSACGAACAIQHAVAQCSTGQCGYVMCLAGYADCDGDPLNGCETQGACPTDMTMAAAPQDMGGAPDTTDMSAAVAAGDMAGVGPGTALDMAGVKAGSSTSGCDVGGSLPIGGGLVPLLLLLGLVVGFRARKSA